MLRVDLRLRPDPASTPVALSTISAYAYYETVGQNWERAALIKARPVAGDLELGQRFLAELAPFIWRKYFDYAAIADIHAMKRQIHAVRGHDRVVVPGHDIKLGRGGIREVEFFVQTQQLIFGGRRPQMRGSRTLDMLRQLRADSWISAEAEEDLTQRLSLSAPDRTSPADGRRRADAAPAVRTRAARALRQILRLCTARILHPGPHPSPDAGRAPLCASVRGGADPQRVSRQSRLHWRCRRPRDANHPCAASGSSNPEAAAETIRGWHFGRRPAVSSSRAREVLTELTPALLEAFAGSGDPDAALAAFDEALARMPASVELMSILRSNASLRELFGDVLGSAPRLAQVIASRPHVLDAAIDPGRVKDFDESLDEGPMQKRVEAYVAQAHSYEDALDRARDFAAEEMFLIGLNLLSGRLDPDRAGRGYSALAQGLVGPLLARVVGRASRRSTARCAAAASLSWRSASSARAR